MPSSAEAQAPVRNLFPFSHKPNTLDRDRIVIPAGWDSWGKISVMRDGFDAKMWGEAWERDLESGEQGTGEAGAKKAYATLVPDQGSKVIILCSPFFIILFTALQPPPLPPFNNPVPEQAFLAKNYDENSKKSDRDPRGAFRNPAEFAGASAGIVGPLGSSSFNLPNVERALSEMESGIGTASTSTIEGTRRLAGRAGTTGRPGLSPLGTSSSPTNVNSVRSPGSPSGNTGTPGATGQSQHEVLQNFFQSLLSTNTKDRTANAAAASRGAAELRTNGLPNGMGDSSM